MLSKSSLLTPRPLARVGRDADAALSALARLLKGPLQFVSFWAAIGLPFAHLGILAQGLESASTALLFVSLLALNAVALYFGHGYKQH
ncbi:hypothetical protein [Halovivax gelatinilyticus]|uniref:hypothetical protein n=1 Tax=Halovivax gelatinilyticus TaxID=2961597 RepID=UPI0020CA94BD|nr:hypothetical protein [Halovivax gelatinilyticus]